MADEENSTYTDTDAAEDTGDADVNESDDLGRGRLGAGERSALGQDAGSGKGSHLSFVFISIALFYFISKMHLD